MNKYKYLNILLILSLIILSIISLFNMINAKYISNVYNNAFIKQFLFIVLGFILIFLFKKTSIFKKMYKYSFYIYIFSIFLLILVLFKGTSINGARCWLNILGISFQPSEFVKITLSILLINVRNKYYENNGILIFKLFMYTLIPSILVFLEPDTGSIIFYIIIFLVVLLSINLKKYWYYIFSTIIVCFLVLFTCLYIFNQDILIKLFGTSLFYRIDRLINFASGSSYQLERALISVATSSFFGVGINNILIYIPEAPTDFIFSFSIGNYGLISAIFILLSYFNIFIYLLFKQNKNNNKISKLFINVYTYILLFSSTYNIFMNLGLTPIMGITLPFLSYGGSSILTHFIFIAIIYNI